MTQPLQRSRRGIGILSYLGGTFDGFARRWKVWAPAKVWVENEWLMWLGPDEFLSAEGMLQSFTRIRDPEDIPTFAKRYGVLNLCGHGLPETHRRPIDPFPGNQKELDGFFGEEDYSEEKVWAFHRSTPLYCVSDCQWWCSTCGSQWDEEGWCLRCKKDGEMLRGRESVAAWLNFAAQARDIVSIAPLLQTGRLPSKKEWERIEPLHPDWANLSQKTLRFRLKDVVDRWLRIGGISLTLDWETSGPSANLSAMTFGLLATQLLAAVVGFQVPAVCDGCGEVYIPERKPYANRPQTYCEVCRTSGVPARMRQRNYRERQRERRRDEQTRS